MYIEPLFLVRKLVQGECRNQIYLGYAEPQPSLRYCEAMANKRGSKFPQVCRANRSQVCGVAKQQRTKNGKSYRKFAD